MTTKNVYVGNIPYAWNEEDIKQTLGKAGPIVQVKLGKGYAFVEFETRQDAENALSLFHGKNWGGRILKLDYDAGEKAKFDKKGGRIRRGGRRSPRSYPPRSYHSYSSSRYRDEPRYDDRDRRYRKRSPSPRYRYGDGYDRRDSRERSPRGYRGNGTLFLHPFFQLSNSIYANFLLQEYEDRKRPRRRTPSPDKRRDEYY